MSQPDLPDLKGRGGVLRPFREDLAPAVLAVLNDPTVSRWWGHCDRERVLNEFMDPEVMAFTIEIGGVLAGIVACTEEADADYRHAAVDIAISSAFQARGLGPDALRTLAGFLFAERGHHRLTIDPATSNRNAFVPTSAWAFGRSG